MSWDLIWTVLNSPVGISAVIFVLSYILGKIFTAKPAWKVYLEKYKPTLIAAVKYAEKTIPDDVENRALGRLNCALQYVLLINNKLDEAILKQALTAVHAEAEKDGNL